MQEIKEYKLWDKNLLILPIDFWSEKWYNGILF